MLVGICECHQHLYRTISGNDTYFSSDDLPLFPPFILLLLFRWVFVGRSARGDWLVFVLLLLESISFFSLFFFFFFFFFFFLRLTSCSKSDVRLGQDQLICRNNKRRNDPFEVKREERELMMNWPFFSSVYCKHGHYHLGNISPIWFSVIHFYCPNRFSANLSIQSHFWIRAKPF